MNRRSVDGGRVFALAAEEDGIRVKARFGGEGEPERSLVGTSGSIDGRMREIEPRTDGNVCGKKLSMVGVSFFGSKHNSLKTFVAVSIT